MRAPVSFFFSSAFRGFFSLLFPIRPNSPNPCSLHRFWFFLLCWCTSCEGTTVLHLSLALGPASYHVWTRTIPRQLVSFSISQYPVGWTHLSGRSFFLCLSPFLTSHHFCLSCFICTHCLRAWTFTVSSSTTAGLFEGHQPAQKGFWGWHFLLSWGSLT